MDSYCDEQLDLILNSNLIMKVFFPEDDFQKHNQRLFVTVNGNLFFDLLQTIFSERQIDGSKLATIELKWKIDKSIKKITDLWSIVRDGLESEILWRSMKMNLVL